MISFTLPCKMIQSIHLNSDTLIPKSQINLIAGKLSMTCLLKKCSLIFIHSKVFVEDLNEE